MAKKSSKKEVSIIWDFLSCALLYAAICYFNGTEYQQELSQESVRRFALIAAVIWFFVYIVIIVKQGNKIVLFRHKDKTKEITTSLESNGPRTYTLTDPATGAQTLYTYDEDSGEWVSEDGSTVLDPDRINQWNRDRISDRRHADDTAEKMSSRTTEQDKINSEKYKKAEEQQEADDRLNEIGISHGVYSGDKDEIREVMGKQQKSAEKISESYNKHSEHMGTVTATAEVTGKLADQGVDAIATINPALKPIQYIYYGGRNFTANLSDAVVNDKDKWSAVRKAAAETIIDCTQAGVDKFGYKFVSYTVGDSCKEVLTAIDEGRISADEIADAAGKGVKDGLKKATLDGVLKLGGKALKKKLSKVELKTESAVKKLTKEASESHKNLLYAYQGGSINKTTYEGAKSVVNSKYVAEVRNIKKMAETHVEAVAKAADVTVQKYNKVANLVENVGNDVVTGNNPFRRGDKLW